ncbi:metal-dependent hydrolase [Geoglobus acetivorans]|uniref:Metal-dependent hydrolase n=1 Tax=Geoglobus acetivorans TaxID=565033 RepID=A0ABZ3H571_GEOAI|nr:metal-dependent hydrolase [Geoglobus acetivorans]
MLLFGHIGITLGIAWLIESRLRIRMDYRLIAVGSLLPDMIDKPAGMLLLLLNNGRVFAHTLLFILTLHLIGLKYRGFLFLSFASFLHLIEDEMWNEPETLFWPLLGGFPARERVGFYEYVERIISEYTPSLSHVFILEVTGFIVILVLVMRRGSLFGARH